ncbi:MAG: SDR family NAD(P)-dependent oxidoreductase [Halioglobus sp.]
MHNTLEGKVAVVTGSGSGIGLTTAQVLAREGASVVVADYDEASAKAVAEGICSDGGKASAVFFDARSEDSVKQLFNFTRETYGALHILHNNVGATDISKDLNVVDLDLDTWDNTFKLCLKSVLMGCKFAIPLMIESGGGSIINTASSSGVYGDVTNTAYGVAKAGVMSLTQYVATQFGDKKIRCNAISPGLIMTPAAEKYLPKEILKAFEEQTLTPEVGKPEDIAELVAYLASDAARYITGQNIRADGGLTIHTPIFAASH